MDCYKTEEQNAVKMVLEKERIKKVDFVCWTHPHDDHTRGLDEIWKEYCTKETCFCCSDIIEADLELYFKKKQKMHFLKSIADIHTSPKREKMKIMYLKDATQVRDWKDKFEENQEGLIVLNTYQQVEDLIDLLDERCTRSDVTNQEYDTDVKRVAKPV